MLAKLMRLRSAGHGEQPTTADAVKGAWLIAFIVSMPYTTLKGWPGRTQAIFIAVVLMIVVSLLFGGAWINSR